MRTVQAELAQQSNTTVDFQLYRVPFFLEPEYLTKPDDFWEPHNERMIRKFGSLEAFERVRNAHGLSNIASMCIHVNGFSSTRCCCWFG